MAQCECERADGGDRPRRWATRSLSLVKKAHEESENACFLHGALPREGKNNKVAIGRCTRIGAWATALTVLGLYLAFLAVPNIFLDDAVDSHSELVWERYEQHAYHC